MARGRRRGLQAEHQRRGQAARVRAVVHAAGIRAGGEQPGDRRSLGVEDARARVDPQSAEGERDRRDHLDHVVGRVTSGAGSNPRPGSSSPASHCRLNSSIASREASPRIAPFLRQVLELVDVLGDRRARAALVGELELVERLDALDVRREHPLVVDALVGDEQRPRLGLIEHGQRAQVVAERLVAEAPPSRLSRTPCSEW